MPQDVKKRPARVLARLFGLAPDGETGGEAPLIDLMKLAERRSEYVAIYIIGPMVERWPVAFGICSDPVAAYHSYQKGWWGEHALHTILWTPGKAAAERIKRNMVKRLAKKKKFFSRSWYDVSAEEANAALLAAAKDEGVLLFDEVERQRRFVAAARTEVETLQGVRSSRTPQALPRQVLMQGQPTASPMFYPGERQNVVPLRAKVSATHAQKTSK